MHWDHICWCYAGIWAARDVDGAGSREPGVTTGAAVAMTTTSGCGSFSEYGGAGNAAMPMGLDSRVGDGSPAAAAVGVVRLHMRMTSS